MKRSVWLSTFLVAAVLSPVVLQANDCLPNNNTKLATLELWIDNNDEISGFSPEHLSYTVELASDAATGSLIFQAEDGSAEVSVEYGSQSWQFAGPSGQVPLDLEYGSAPVEVEVQVSGASRRYFVNIDRALMRLPGLSAPVQVTTDVQGVPHIVAQTLEDAMRMYGYVVARDRFFDLDLRRRTIDGRRAELTGRPEALSGDIEIRRRGWRRRAEERTLPLMTGEEIRLLEAYGDGINAWLETNPLPTEYADLEITEVQPWSLIDTLISIWGGPLYDYETLDTDALYQSIDALGEDAGRALFFQDLGRVAPMYPVAIVPDALSVSAKQRAASPKSASVEPWRLGDAALRLIRSYVEEVGPEALKRVPSPGSNNWVIAGKHTVTGMPMVAGDGHNAIQSPNLENETHITVTNDPDHGSLNIHGITFPSFNTPGPDIGAQTEYLAWTSTTKSDADTCDYFIDRLVRDDPACPTTLCIESAGAMHPVEVRTETFQLNAEDDGIPDNMDPTVTTAEIRNVPFRCDGPIIEETDPSIFEPGGVTETTVMTQQCAAFEGTTATRAWLGMITAKDVLEFVEAARYETTVPWHYVVADTAGNIAYVATAEVPLRADLEAGMVHGELPNLVRDGSGPANWIPDPGRSQGQTLPYRVLPPEENGLLINPPAGFVVTANNSTFGLDLDNDLTNDFRPSDPMAIRYLGAAPSGDPSMRAGRITKLIQDHLVDGDKISSDDMKAWQANTQALDAELFVPFILEAWDHALAAEAPPGLSAFAANAALAEAVGRLATWDFSHPTGIPEGYDASDVDGIRGPVPAEEAESSVAATLYATWRALMLQNVSSTAQVVGAVEISPLFTLVGLHHILAQQPFTGVGASGIDFFSDPVGLSPEERRDVTILSALRNGLLLLASPVYQNAFGGSTDQSDYNWGRLNRLQIENWDKHVIIPPGAGFESLGPGLPGIPRDGAPMTVNVAWPERVVNIKSLSEQAFVFVSSAMSRLVFSVGDPAAGTDGVLGWMVLGGSGNTGDPNSPYYAVQLGQWLTVDYHRVPMNNADVAAVADVVEVFGP